MLNRLGREKCMEHRLGEGEGAREGLSKKHLIRNLLACLTSCLLVLKVLLKSLMLESSD